MPGVRASTSSRSRTRLDLHNMVVCTLCSCYPWPVLGLPPVWYKSAPYRSKAVKDPRGVLRDFGFELPEGTRNSRLGFHCRNPLSRAADAPRRHRRLERGAARRARHPRQHDRHRPAETAARGRADGRRARHGRRRLVGSGTSPNRTSRCSTPNGSGARSRSRWRWACPAAGISICRALPARIVPPARLSQQELLPDLARRPRATDGSSAGWSRPTRSQPASRCIRQSPWRRR